MKLKGHSKARILQNIEDELSLFSVPNLSIINAKLFKKNKGLIEGVMKTLPESDLLVIRSSAADEDESKSSSAGEYDSFLNVPSNSIFKITEAIEKVILSYERKRALLVDDEVIIQHMVQNTTMSGVIFTHDLNTGAPYYVINYDDQSGLTDTVTSGLSEYSNRTLYIHRNAINDIRSERFAKLLRAVQELELVLENQFLDIEFAFSEDMDPYLLQVRAITTQKNWNRGITKQIDTNLLALKSFVKERLKKPSGQYGDTTIFGQMPDWNPIEMIGRAPRALAASLYQILITDQAWSLAREKMGYTTPVAQPLMVMLAGQPFIDVQLSFISFLPKAIRPEVASKLVNHWLDRLRLSPELHDKVEFEVAITTFSFDLNEKIEKLISEVLSKSEKEELKKAYQEQTIKLVKGEDPGSLQAALNDIETLKIKQKSIKSDPKPNLSTLFPMLYDCINFGTIPFSILARHGFIAQTILKSLLNVGIITEKDLEYFLASIRTVASEFVDDMDSFQFGEMSRSEFMDRYGHLRPGTYDILSKRYDQMDGMQTEKKYRNSKIEQKKLKSGAFSQKKKNQINKLLFDNGFGDYSADELIEYLRSAIVAREYSKFVFTKSVSDILELIASYSLENGLSRDEASHIPVSKFLELAKSSSEVSPEEFLREISIVNQDKHKVNSAIRLPQLLFDEAGTYIVPFQVSQPNFITQKSVTGPCILLNSDFDNKTNLTGKVVLIEGADPGFDWIFSQNIKALVTKYGGVNSHMAIRCAEFGIPAAIGCGEQRFERLQKSNQVSIDCSSGLINPIE